MEDKKNMNIALAVVICLVLAGVLIFISINKKANMNQDNNIGGVPSESIEGSDVSKTGDTVAMNYTGRLEDGTVFDSNVDPKFNHVEPFIFTLGAGQVIAGWDKQIVGMKIGEKKTITIAPEDAYGATGIPGAIPPNSTLVFDVELLAIKQ
jgi:FKBP-type peptidyl-prolyl cis-trans isomerase